MPHRSSLFSSSPSILLPLRIRSFPLAPFIRLPRRLFLFRLYSAPVRNAGSLRSFITEAPVHIRCIPISCSRTIDKVIPITESCSSLISDRYNHKSPILCLYRRVCLTRYYLCQDNHDLKCIINVLLLINCALSNCC